MEIKKISTESSSILTISGKIGNNTSNEFLKELLDTIPDKEKTILDCMDLEYINSTGLRALLQGLQLAEEIGTELVVKNVSEEINELFNITGFDELLKIV